MDKHCLIGKTLTGVALAKDKKAILFKVADGEPIEALAEGDCCSETWIEHVEMPALGFPAVVTAAGDIDTGRKPDQDNDGDVIQFYGFRIATDRGEVVIDYRNSSNGYYGGSLSWPGEHHYNGVYGQNKSDKQWEDLR